MSIYKGIHILKKKNSNLILCKANTFADLTLVAFGSLIIDEWTLCSYFGTLVSSKCTVHDITYKGINNF